MLSATAQSEGGVSGGSSVAFLLALMILVARPARGWQGPGKALHLGMLIGTLALESHVTAAVLVVAIAAGVLVEEERPTRAVLGVVGGSALACWGLLRLPRLIRSLAPPPRFDFGRAIARLEGTALAKPLGGVLGRLGDEGVVLVVLAALGLGLAVATARLRGAALSLAVLILLYALSVLGEGRFLTAEDIAPLHLLAIVALAVGAAMALAAIAGTLLAWRLPMAKRGGDLAGDDRSDLRRRQRGRVVLCQRSQRMARCGRFHRRSAGTTTAARGALGAVARHGAAGLGSAARARHPHRRARRPRAGDG